MGWKALKTHFQIERHTLEVDKGKIKIGSGYIPELIVIDMATGELKLSETFPEFMRETYPALGEATPAELLALIQQEDQFDDAIPVFTYKDAEIIEKRCEKLGYPNVTHDGEMMYENTFSTDREKIIASAVHDATLAVRFAQEHVDRLKADLVKAQAYLEDRTEVRNALWAAFPHAPVPRMQRAEA